MTTEITKGQLAWLSQDDQFEGLPGLRDEVKAEHQIVRSGTEKENTQLKCHLVFFGLIALIAAGGATWLFLTQGQSGYIPALCLSALSGVFVLGILITAIVSVCKRRALQDHYAKQTEAAVEPNAILQGMLHPELSDATIRTIANRLSKDQRVGLIEAFCNTYEIHQEPGSEQEKVFKALTADSASLELIPKLGRPFAVALLRYADESSPELEPLLDSAVAATSLPESAEEASYLAKYPKSVLRLAKPSEKELNRPYCDALLHHLPKDAPLALALLFNPETEDEALHIAGHPKAVEAYAEQEIVNQPFVLDFINYIPSDDSTLLDPSKDVTLLDFLFSLGSPKSKKGAEVYDKHPKTLDRTISKDKYFYVGYLQVAKENYPPPECIKEPNQQDIDIYARYPTAMARLSLSNSPYFGPASVFSVFSAMSILEKIEFLETIDNKNPQSKYVVTHILQNLLKKEFVNQNDTIRSEMVSLDFRELLEQLGRFPELVAQSLFETHFGMEGSLLQHMRFLGLFFTSMREQDKQVCITSSIAILKKQILAAKECAKWLTLEPFPEWLKWILLNSPELVAKGVCLCESELGHCKGEELAKEMTTDNRAIYESQVMKLFLSHYKKMVFEERQESTALKNRLIACKTFMETHPDWVKTNQNLAKSYVQLFMNAHIQEMDLTKGLMKDHEELFNIYTVTFNGYQESIPAYRLASLSPNFAGDLTSKMKGSTTKTLCLDDPDLDGIEELFLGYLKTGEVLQTEIDPLRLSALAHRYHMGHLSQLCIEMIKEALDKETLVDILGSVMDHGLWDLMPLCFDFIQKFGNQEAVDLFTNLVDPNRVIEEFFLLAIECSALGITLSCKFTMAETKEYGQFEPHFYIPMGTRHVHIDTDHPLNLEILNKLRTIISPTKWSTANYAIAIKHALNTRGDKIFFPIFFPIFLECAEENKDDKLDDPLSFESAIFLYTRAIQYNTPKVAAACLAHIPHAVTIPQLETILEEAYLYKLQDLKLIALIGASQNSDHPELNTIKNKSQDFPEIIELAISCAKERLEITYNNGEHHVVVSAYNKNNREMVLSLLTKLHKIRPITHVYAQSLEVSDAVRSDIKFLGNVCIELKSPPRN